MKNLLIITGASSGIGKNTAEVFQKNDWKIINISRRSCPIKGVQSFQTDLSVPKFIEKIQKPLEAAIQNADKICLIHNAALLNKDNLKTLTDGDFRRVLQINILAPHVLNRTIMPFMKSGSSILYVGSTLSEKAVAGAFSYVTSKHAQMGMMKATCQDLIGSGIHTAGICPGFTNTEMLNKHVQYDEEILSSIRAMNVFNRLIEPKEIAELLYFCATHPVINGAVLHANLGQVEH